MLGSFLFSGEDVDKKVSVLSGGERSRLALCKMLLQTSNLLVLDEPTNHLDIASKEVLKAALKAYKGTLLIVSHDRDFLAGLTNKVLEFRDGYIKTHIGDINDYLSFRKIESMRELERKTKVPVKPLKVPLGKQQRKDLDKQIKQTSNQLSKVERQISDLESLISVADENLANPEKSSALLADEEFFKNYQGHKDTLEDCMEKWAELEDQLEQLTAQRD